MRNKLYLECTSGISGDMTVAALLDLGADREKLERALKSLPVKGFDIKISRVVKSGIDACDFDVLLDQEHENHDHDMEYLHGHHHEGRECNHAHGTGTAQDHHHHEHRGIKEITYIIEHSAMTENAKKIALRIFEILAEAESKAHNVPVDQVHFHEVGAVDSIVDIVSVAVCLDNLDVTDIHYDKKISDLQRRLDAQYDKIDEVEETMTELKSQIYELKKNQIDADSIYGFLGAFNEVYSECTDAEKKQFMQAFIERIDIFPERREDGNWIQNIKFQFPVPIIKEGKEVAQIKGISLDKEKSDEHMISLEKLSTLETIVSLNKTAI